MTASYKTKVRVTQQYQQVRHETYRISRDGDPSTINLSDHFSFPTNSGEVPRSMPAKNTLWEKLPFAYPENKENPKKSVEINEILSFSLQQQVEDEISNNVGFIIILTSRCLSAIGIDNQVESGYRHLNGESLPHIWLIIDGYLIDNTFVNELSEGGRKYLSKNTPRCYYAYSSDFSNTETNIPNSKQTTSLEILELRNIIKKRIIFYRQKPDRALALGLNGEQAYNYYFSMIRHMYDVYGVCITGIDPKIRFMCWWCECFPKSGKHFISDILGSGDIKETKSLSKSTWKFSHCSLCMVANYCSLECQRSDWIDSHKITCFSRGAMYPPLGDGPFNSDTL